MNERIRQLALQSDGVVINKMMTKFTVSVQIGFYSEPYEYHTIWAYDKKDALACADSMLSKFVGHRFLNVVE